MKLNITFFCIAVDIPVCSSGGFIQFFLRLLATPRAVVMVSVPAHSVGTPFGASAGSQPADALLRKDSL